MPDPAQSQQFRRNNGPMTDKGAARKTALLVAARTVFESKGFIETRVSDIAKEARVAHGTFYTYFDTKEAIFTAVSLDVIDSMMSGMAHSIPTADLGDRVYDSVRRFVEVYRPHATMLGLMEQVGTFSPEMRKLRLGVRETFVDRTRRGIARMVSTGLAEPDLDVEYTAENLGAMLEFTCYVSFCLGRDFDEERLIGALAAIWTKSIAQA